jgi:sulfofructose kinase
MAAPATAPSRWDVVGLGANSVDTVTLLPASPEPHGPRAKLRILRQTVCAGGQVATALATCARMGLRAAYIGATGHDDNGRRIRHELESRSVDVSGLVVRDATSQFAHILLDEHTGERIVLWSRDDHLALHEGDITAEVIGAARLLHVDDVDQPAAIFAARLARRAGLPVTSDLDRVTDLTEALTREVTVPIFAEHVTTALTGLADQERALRTLRGRHAGLLVVTLGPHGVMALEGDRFHHVPAFDVDVVDTTGAGDVFRGAFIVALLRQWPVDRVLRFANAAAALACTRLGAMNGVPSLVEVERLLGTGSARP